jgi:hypothetical protein
VLDNAPAALAAASRSCPCCSPPRYTDVDAVGFSLLAVSAFGLATVTDYAASGLIDRPLTAEFIGCSFVGGPIGMILASQLFIARRRSPPVRRLIFIDAEYVLWRSAGLRIGALTGRQPPRVYLLARVKSPQFVTTSLAKLPQRIHRATVHQFPQLGKCSVR